MNGLLTLSITTPLEIVLREGGIASLRGEDASGGFGILPGHADFVTVIDAGVLRWRPPAGPWRFCAVRGGVFAVVAGREAQVACRDAVLGDDLATLQARVAAVRRERDEAARSSRAQSASLHARAIRRLMRDLTDGGDRPWFGEEEQRP
ncbi:F0F1 ATP synthase subunit epsilon [Albidovulum sp.]